MASKLEKAQAEYEKLLRDLGERAQMVGMFERADPTLQENYKKAKDTLADRKVELEFIHGEIARLQAEMKAHREDLERQLAEAKESLNKTEKSIGAKKGKAGPLKKKLTGAEYDIHFTEKGLAEEMRKLKHAEESEREDKIKEHRDIIGNLKVELMKRRKEINELKRQLAALQSPTKDLGSTAEEIETKIAVLEEQIEALDESEETVMLADLEKQREEKKREIQLSDAHILDSMADLGENLYEKRLSHPVLNKYYSDIDVVAETIDHLQEESKK